MYTNNFSRCASPPPTKLLILWQKGYSVVTLSLPLNSLFLEIVFSKSWHSMDKYSDLRHISKISGRLCQFETLHQTIRVGAAVNLIQCLISLMLPLSLHPLGKACCAKAIVLMLIWSFFNSDANQHCDGVVICLKGFGRQTYFEILNITLISTLEPVDCQRRKLIRRRIC